MKKSNTQYYLNIINKIEKIRSKNNVNWMDLLRLAFRISPNKARNLIRKINSQDKRISNLLRQLGKR